MMRYIAQTDSISLLREALQSECDGVRYGAEFCEHRIPSLAHLRQGYEETEDVGKTFSYSVPILSNIGLEKIRSQLEFLREMENVDVTIGDFGALNLMHGDNKPRLRLGRPRVYIPGRSPWSQITRLPNPGFFALRRVEKIFYQTSLNYIRSLEFFKSQGITGADVDWIPKCFPQYNKITKKGLQVAIHTYAVPIAVTMKCHTARFTGEPSPTQCSMPCIEKAFKIHQKELSKSFILNGNVVYRKVEPTRKEKRQLKGTGITETIILMGPVSKITSTQELDQAISALSTGA